MAVSRDIVTSRLLSGVTSAWSADTVAGQGLALGPQAGRRIDFPEHDPSGMSTVAAHVPSGARTTSLTRTSCASSCCVTRPVLS